MKYIVLIFIVLCSYGLKAQTNLQRSTKISITSSMDSFWLGNDFIVSSSLKVLVDSSVPLVFGNDYTYDQTVNTLILAQKAKDLLFLGRIDSAAAHYTLYIYYSIIPVRLQKEYSNLSLLQFDSAVSNEIRARYPIEDITSTKDNTIDFSNSGGFTRGLIVGSNQVLTTQSSFNLSFNGSIDTSFHFQGALSEESSVIQPEGNTQLLRDLDRIFINFDYLNSLKISLGDMYMTSSLLHKGATSIRFRDPVYANIGRKVLGASAYAESGNLFGQIGAAVSRGSYYTNNFQGENGFQGPYRLSAQNGNRAILIIAGTEQIYIDGVLQQRGELNDYIIDYATAEIRFQPRRIITNVSRITVDFQYTDEAYSRYLVYGTGGGSIGNGLLAIRGIYLREGDNQDAPRNITLTDADKETIRLAGNNPRNSYKSGTQYIGRDSSGRAKGVYVRGDTILESSHTFYRFSPGDSNALYYVNFSYVGKHTGNYQRISSTEYNFVGRGNGDYDTIIYLPLPSVTQLIGTQISSLLFNDKLHLTSEYTHSIYEPNRFLGDIIQGNSYVIGAEYDDTLIGSDIRFSITLKEQFQDSLFKNLDRVRPAESLRTYGVEGITSSNPSLINQERERSAKVIVSSSRFAFSTNYGSYKNYSTQYRAEDMSASVEVKEDSLFIPTMYISYSNIPTSRVNDSITSVWNILKVNTSKQLGESLTLTPNIGYIHTVKTSYLQGILSAESFDLQVINGGFLFSDRTGISGSIDLKYYSEDSVRNTDFERISDNFQYQLQMQGSLSKEFNLSSSFSLLKKKYSDSTSTLTSRGNYTNYYISVAPRYKMINSFIIADAAIDISSELSSRFERIFLQTQPGYGSYKYLGDLNSNNLLDPSEFETARYSDQANYILITRPTDNLYPTTLNNIALRLKLSPSYLQVHGILSFLHYTSSETSLKLSKRNLSVLSLKDYFDWISNSTDTNILSFHTQIQQDIYLFESTTIGQLRFRFIERAGVQQYDLGIEDYYHRALSVQGKYSISSELHTETNIEILSDKVQSTSLLLSRSINTQKIKSVFELVYTPLLSAFNNTFNLYYTAGKDNSQTSTSMTVYGISDKIVYSFSSNIRTGLQIGLDNLLVAHGVSFFDIPYSLTEGRDNGLTARWELFFEYYLGNGISSSATYSGRRISPYLSSAQTIHSARAEIRATF